VPAAAATPTGRTTAPIRSADDPEPTTGTRPASHTTHTNGPVVSGTRTVRAAVFTAPGSRAEVVDVELDAPRAGEVEVQIAAAGVCHSDLHVIRGEWAVPTPLVLGHEGAGVVTALGDGVTGLAIGDHVVLSWVPQCGDCRQCRLARPWQCEVAFGVVAAGGVLFDGTSRFHQHDRVIHHYLGVSSFAERVVVPVSGAVRVRSDAPLDVIAIVGCAVATGVGAVRNTAAVERGATVAVIGCGGVGLSCIQGARLAGASRIVAVDVNPAKLDVARRLGATDIVNAANGDPVETLRSVVSIGLDYVFDAIGKIETTEQAIRAIGLGGAAVIVGLPPTGARAAFEPLMLAEANQRILGSNYGSVDPQRDIPLLVDLYMDGQLDLDSLISGRRPLAEAAEALDDLEAGRTLRTLLIG
jgi:S-(hydroxymethyl)glutathione dehydrogenase / alcohol dehydrogenase